MMVTTFDPFLTLSFLEELQPPSDGGSIRRVDDVDGSPQGVSIQNVLNRGQIAQIQALKDCVEVRPYLSANPST